MTDKRQPPAYAVAATRDAKIAFAENVMDSLAERERKMAVAIDDRFGALVSYARRQRETYGENAELDAALAKVDAA